MDSSLDKKKSAIVTLLLAVNGALIAYAPASHVRPELVALASSAILAVCALLNSPILKSDPNEKAITITATTTPPEETK